MGIVSEQLGRDTGYQNIHARVDEEKLRRKVG